MSDTNESGDRQPGKIVDPADRVADPEFVSLMMTRYRNRPPVEDGIVLTEDEYLNVYSNFCDVASHLLWPDRYDLTFDDDMSHTSEPARRVANILMEAAGFVNVLRV